MGGRSVGGVQSAHLLGGRSHNAVRKGEAELAVVHLEGRHSLAVLGGNGGSLDDLDRLVAGSVATGHVVICEVVEKEGKVIRNANKSRGSSASQGKNRQSCALSLAVAQRGI